MGWWEQYDGTVIGDGLADIAEGAIDKVVKDLVEAYPQITREQVLHTIAFCSGYLKHFDEGKKFKKSDKLLQVVTVKQREEWIDKHGAEPNMSKRIAPNTTLMNVRNPFTNEIV